MADQNEETLMYEGNPKHKHPWQPGRKGSLCPKKIDMAKAQELLSQSVQDGSARYATYGGVAYCAREHLPGKWHGHPIQWREVPPQIVNEWRRSDQITRREIKARW
jgi:hypothetical protein